MALSRFGATVLLALALTLARALRGPLPRPRASVRAALSLPGKNFLQKRVKPGTLILVRHGESAWNANYTFTGWADPDLSELGRREVKRAARLLLEGGYTVDVAYTSMLKRAISTTWILLRELELVYLPVMKDWRLNERCYGSLQGLSKPDTARIYGEKIVQAWRRSLRVRPPPLDASHPYYPGRERKYQKLDPGQVPLTESLLDTMHRTIPLWEEEIKRDIAAGKNVLVAAHANSLRGLMTHIDSIAEDEVPGVHVPNCIPLVYKFDDNMQPVRQELADGVISGVYLESREATREALRREAQLSTTLPGYDSMAYQYTPVLRALSTLQMEREAAAAAAAEAEAAAERALKNLHFPNDTSDFSQLSPTIRPAVRFDKESPLDSLDQVASTKATGVTSSRESSTAKSRGDGAVFRGDASLPKRPSTPMEKASDLASQSLMMPSQDWAETTSAAAAPEASSVNDAAETAAEARPEQTNTQPVVVIIRHGKTDFNKLGLFTGWQDAPLSKDGIAEARNAGRLLKHHGIVFDVVHTSWLSRAIETAWLALEELDHTWVPIQKTWRLNERMYGALEGLSKKMIAQRHGQDQLKLWRRSYGTRPPPVSSFSPNYPGNDVRYTLNVKDRRISVKETFIRSLEAGRLQLSRKLPHTESLRDCMERTIPYYTDVIVPSTIDQGKSVLISSSENAIRGMLMHLCDIPAEMICDIEIPTGLPMLYDPRQKCIKLLEDPEGEVEYNFGAAGHEIFKPCDISHLLEELQEEEAAEAAAAEAERAERQLQLLQQHPPEKSRFRVGRLKNLKQAITSKQGNAKKVETSAAAPGGQPTAAKEESKAAKEMGDTGRPGKESREVVGTREGKESADGLGGKELAGV